MQTISEKHAEVAQRPKAPVLKTGCATHSGSSNLPLGVKTRQAFPFENPEYKNIYVASPIWDD